MDKYTKLEKTLRNLEMDKMYLESLEKDLKILELEYSIKGVNFDSIGGGCGISDTTATTAIRLADRKQELELRIARKKNELEHLENVLKCLTETEYKVIILFYVKYKPFWVIAREVDYSITQVKRIKKDAMNRIMRGMYGEC